MENKTKSRDLILNTTIELLLEKIDRNDETPKPPSFREIASRAEVSLGLINYYFKTQDNLIRQAVKWYIGTKVIEPFDPFKEGSEESLSAIEKLTKVILGPLDFIYNHPKLARISILNDFSHPTSDDNSSATWQGFYLTIKKICNDRNDREIRFAAWSIISSIHEAFLRPEHFKQSCDLDLTMQEHRNKFAAYLAEMHLEKAIP